MNEKEIYGKLPGLQALPDIQSLNKMYRFNDMAMQKNPRWFKLRGSIKWWHWIIRPIRTYKLRMWLKDVEKKLHDEIDIKELENHMVDLMAYGTSAYKKLNNNKER